METDTWQWQFYKSATSLSAYPRVVHRRCFTGIIVQILAGDKSVHIERNEAGTLDLDLGDFVMFSNGQGTTALCELLTKPKFYDSHTDALSDLNKRGKLLQTVPRDHCDVPVQDQASAERAYRWICKHSRWSLLLHLRHCMRDCICRMLCTHAILYPIHFAVQQTRSGPARGSPPPDGCGVCYGSLGCRWVATHTCTLVPTASAINALEKPAATKPSYGLARHSCIGNDGVKGILHHAKNQPSRLRACVRE